MPKTDTSLFMGLFALDCSVQFASHAPGLKRKKVACANIYPKLTNFSANIFEHFRENLGGNLWGN